MANKKIVKSPCIGVCVLDANNICEGCFRSSDEITRWSVLSFEEQVNIVEKSWERAKNAGRLI